MFTRLFFLILFVFANLYCLVHATMWSNATLEQQEQEQQQQQQSQQEQQNDIFTRLDQIRAPFYVTTLQEKKQQRVLKKLDHLSPPSTSPYRLCQRFWADSSGCSVLLFDRAKWHRLSRQRYQSFQDDLTRLRRSVYNGFVRRVADRYYDAKEMLRWQIHDWLQFPWLEWRVLQFRWVTRWHLYHDYLHTIMQLNLKKEKKKRKIDNNNNDTLSYENDKHQMSTSQENNHDEDHPTADNEYAGYSVAKDGCYHDVFQTTLCLAQQRVLGSNGLKERIDALFEGMSYDERTRILRHQRRFILWATRASEMTSEAIRQSHSLWLEQMQVAYRFLDDALSLNTDLLKGDAQNLYASSSCPRVTFPFSVSPFDTSLENTVFSASTVKHLLQRRPAPPISFVSLLPLHSNNEAMCLKPLGSDNEKNLDKQKQRRNNKDDNNSKKKKEDAALLEQYNINQYKYILSRIQKELTSQMNRLEKSILQEYYRYMMRATPTSWEIQQVESHRVAQQMYQELRLHISVSLQQLYKRSFQQLATTTQQYDSIVLGRVSHAYKEWNWVQQRQAQKLHNFYPQQYYMRQEGRFASSFVSSSSSSFLSSSSPLSFSDNEEQQRDWPRQHNDDTDYDAQCQQWWKQNKSWSVSRFIVSALDKLGYKIRKNKRKDESHDDNDNYSTLSAVVKSPPPLPTLYHTYSGTTAINHQATKFIAQRADRSIQIYRHAILEQWDIVFQELDRDTRAVWVAAMDQVQGRDRFLFDCDSTCIFYIYLVKWLILLIILFFL